MRQKLNNPNEVSKTVGLINLYRKFNHSLEFFYTTEDEVKDFIENDNDWWQKSLSAYFCLYQSVSIDLSRVFTPNVINTSYMLWDSPKLEKVDLSGWDLSKVILSEGMFEGCNKLKTIILRGCNDATVNLIKTQLAADGLTDVEIITN